MTTVDIADEMTRSDTSEQAFLFRLLDKGPGTAGVRVHGCRPPEELIDELRRALRQLLLSRRTTTVPGFSGNAGQCRGEDDGRAA